MSAVDGPVGLPTWRDYSPGDPDVCVWCRVSGCSIKSIEVVHGPTCPSVTGLWPVMPADVDRGVRCAVDGCGHVFDLGEYRAEVPDPADSDVVITVCVPCSLLHRDEAWR